MKRLSLAALLAAVLLPSTLVVHRAFAADDDGDEADEMADAQAELSKKKAKLLAGIPGNEAILINVTRKELPASPDLLNLGKRGTKALARCVADNVDDQVRTTCAVLLGRLGDRAALPALQGALEAWNVSVRRAAIGALRAIPDASSVEPLKKLLAREDEDPWNKAAAYRTLGVLSDQKAVKVLREALHAPPGNQSSLREAAFEGLWRSRHLMAHATLVSEIAYALGVDDVPTIARAERAAAEVRAPELVKALVPLMEHADAHVRNRAVYALGKIGDKSATKALVDHVEKVREARMLNNIAFALERLDAPAFYKTVQGLIGHKQAAIRMNAAFVLGDVERPEGLPMLTKALSDANDYVRVSAVAALGKLDTESAIPSLEPLVKDKNPVLREEAIFSIFSLSGGKRRDLVYDELVATKDPLVKRRATLALAKVLDPRVAGELLKCVEKGACPSASLDGYLGTKSADDAGIPGRLLLAWARGRSDLTDLVGRARPLGSAPMAASDVLASVAEGSLRRAGFAIDLLGDVGDASAPKVLEPLLASDKTHLRLHGALALSRFSVGTPENADAQLFRDLDQLPADWLPSAVRLVARVKEPATRVRLTKLLVAREKSDDVALAIACTAVHMEWDPETAVFRMLDALASKGARERELAEWYLIRSKHALTTGLLRRALAREPREPVKVSLRRVLDARGGSGDAL